MFISFDLPLCELRHLNLSTFQVAVTINPCLRSPQVTEVSWIGWIKRQNAQEVDYATQLLKRPVALPNLSLP